MNETDPGTLPQWQHTTCPDDVSGYTPTTDEIRNVWGEFSEYGGLTNRTSGGSLIDARYAEFDRWLATHDRDIQVQALRDAAYALRTDEAAYGGNRAVLGPPEGASWLLRRAARLTDTSEGEEK